MKRLSALLALAVLAFASTLAKADPITYTFNQTYTQDATDYFTLTGTLTTDGVIGAVAASDITGYDLFVSETTFSTVSTEFSSTGGASLAYGGGLSATSTHLSFGFDSHDTFFLTGASGFGSLTFQPDLIFYTTLELVRSFSMSRARRSSRPRRRRRSRRRCCCWGRGW